MQKIRKIAKTAMLLAILGLLFHDFVPHHHHENNDNQTCHHHTEKHNSNDFSLEQANNLHKHLNHSGYSKLYKQILFNFTFIEIQKTEIPKKSELILITQYTFVPFQFFKNYEAHSQSRRGPPTA